MIVFHEKEGRRHAHAVWSRINADSMTAQNLPHFKIKLRDISRSIYLEQGWKMPKGLMNSKERDPRNFTLEQWQQAKRIGHHAKDLKTMMQDCWAVSDSRAAFENTLSERGMMLAKGDRRGFVALTPEGEVLSVARYASKKAKEVRAKLGSPDNLPSVTEAREQISSQMGQTVKKHIVQAHIRKIRALAPLEQRRQTMTNAHRHERSKLDGAQQQRWSLETRQRSERFQKGVKGLWSRLTGHHKELQSRNIQEARQALQRDKNQRHGLICSQLKDRQILQGEIKQVRSHYAKLLLDLRQDQTHYKTLMQARVPKQDRAPKQETVRQHLKPQFDRLKGSRHTAKSPSERIDHLRNKTAQRPDKSFDRER